MQFHNISYILACRNCFKADSSKHTTVLMDDGDETSFDQKTEYEVMLEIQDDLALSFL